MVTTPNNTFTFSTITSANGTIPTAFSIAYARDYWSDTWGELLRLTLPSGETINIGTRDTEYLPDICAKLGIDMSMPGWHKQVWQRASESPITLTDGSTAVPFWTLQDGRAALESYIHTPYEGCILVATSSDGDIAGFSAFCIGTSQTVKQRFQDYRNECLPSGTYGIFLDHAVAEKYRGQGLGSTLFDKRIRMILQTNAAWITGQTIDTQPAQFLGNYSKRGLRPEYQNPTNKHKYLFLAKRGEILDR